MAPGAHPRFPSPTPQWLRLLAAALASLAGGLGCLAGSPPAGPPRHVVHISVDGLGAVYLKPYLAETPRDFPAFDRLRREGAFTLNARCDYDVSLTVPNQCTILTGRPVLQQPAAAAQSAPHGITFDYDPGYPWTIHSLGNTNVPYKASVFDVAHDHGLLTAFFAGKQKLDLFARGYSAENGAPDRIGEDNGRNKLDIREIIDWVSPELVRTNDSNLVTRVVATLATAAPRYTFLHLAEPDISGHYFYWGTETYREAVRHVDRQLARVLEAIEANPALRSQTAIVLTSDHGGGDASGWHAYPDVPCVYTIPLFVWGPGVPAGADLYELFSNRTDPGPLYLNYDAPGQPLRDGDSANIALALLGLPPIPGSVLVPRFKPYLSIARTPFGLALYWPITGEALGIEWADACSSPTWHPFTNRVQVEAAWNASSLTNDADSPARFFRLRKPADANTMSGPGVAGSSNRE